MRHRSFSIALLLLPGIAYAQGVLSSPEAAAREAEAFVMRHGFTGAGHPSDAPVENASLFDMLSSPDELIARRRGALAPRAVCVRRRGDGYSVLFRSTHEKDRYLFVALTAGERPYVGHQSVGMSADCKSVSPSP